jgi:uncharacterized protein (TIGR00156 family)
MKKSWYLLPIALLIGGGMAGAQQAPQQPQKQAKPSAKSASPVTSVKAAARAADDRRVQLKGKIVADQGRNVYLFEDDTGKIPVVIGGKALPAGQKLGPGMPVHVTGRVDRTGKGAPRIVASAARIVIGAGAGTGGGKGD